MNNKFDELAKSMAQSVTRRQALRKFGVGLVASIAASLGVRTAWAAPRRPGYCEARVIQGFPYVYTYEYTGRCLDPVTCQYGTSSDCKGGGIKDGDLYLGLCNGQNANPCDTSKRCSF